MNRRIAEAVCETRAGTAVEFTILRMDTKCNPSEEFHRVAGCSV